MDKLIMYVSVTILLVIGLFYVISNYFYHLREGEKNLAENVYRTSLSGEYVCLPHSDSVDLDAAECALGIETDEGDYYVVDFALMSQKAPRITVGDYLIANGLVTPLESIETNRWDVYPIQALFSVTDSVEVIAK